MTLLTLFETQAMPKTTSRYRKQLFTEIDAVPEEYLPFLLQLIRTYRESVDLKPAADSFRRGWREAQTGEVLPIEQLWEGVNGA
jgi:hypothetical protein